jgi:sarcosine oxidase, subunit alpha
MSGTFRAPTGGRIDRARALRFTFDGRAYTGFRGDTLASALLANGVHLVGRSFKYHRPRGILAAGSEEPNALVAVRRDGARYTPNLRATQVELYEGLEAHSQNRWPSLTFDLGAVNDLLSPFIPAGFYYKTFMWPRGAWRALYEPYIRAAAGLGRAPSEADPDRYANRFAHCDVLVVGAGPTGLSAALTAAQRGARVILCDEQSELGGSFLGSSNLGWLNDAREALRAFEDRVTLLPRTTAFGYFPHNFVALNERLTDHLAAPSANRPRERQWQVRAQEVVLATGAIERPLVFPGNDRPGIMLASAARSFLNRYGAIPGRRAVIVTTHDEAYRAALDLQAAGVQIAVIADLRTSAKGELPEAARRAGIEVQEGAAVISTAGRLRVSRAQVASIDPTGERGPARTVRCDLVLMCGGFTPSVHLFSQSRGKLAWDEALCAFVPAESEERVRAAGACRGVLDPTACIEDGRQAGAAAVTKSERQPQSPTRAVDAPGALVCAAGSLPGKAFVDWQNDVTVKDLQLAMREGFRSIEHIKRYTTTGMATDQGKTSNLNALGVVATQLGRSIPQVGLTTFRMPYTPVSFGSFAGTDRGDLFDPIRTAPAHEWAAARGAVFEDVGLWKRARYFPRPGEDMHAAVARECRAVRSACGLFDASTLGKIEVVGRDAVEFMNRMYVNAWTSLAVGRCRYGVLLGEDGFVLDDSVVARIAQDRFHVTTTTGGAARVLALMEDYLQTEWNDLSVWLTSSTEQWAVIAVQGPRARQVLQPLVDHIDIGAAALPHMSVAQGRICAVPMRLFRVSFTGELGFEVNVPADFGPAVWEAIFASGERCGITPYGTEAMHVLRAEKGYIIVGQETDGTVTPDDVGLAWAIGKSKPDFVGKRSLQRPALVAEDRKQLVGLLTVDPRTVLEEGAQVMLERGQHPHQRPIGHVTSSYASATLDRSIALALVAGGRARLDQTLYVSMPHGDVPVRVTSPVFYDPEGECLQGPDEAARDPSKPAPNFGSQNSARRQPPHVAESNLLRGLRPATRYILRGPPDVLIAAAQALGVPASPHVCRAQETQGRVVLWLGPDERLLLGPDREREALRDALERALTGTPHSLVDVSHRQSALEVVGPYAPTALNIGCPLDLHPTAFPVGMCTRTILNKAEIVLWRKAEERFHLEVSRSYLPYVCGLLGEAAIELT